MDNLEKEIKRKIYTIAIFLVITAFLTFSLYIFHLRENIFRGLIEIITSPAGLITDFLSLGGIGAGFINAILLTLLNLFLIKFLKMKVNGLILASLFTSFGFSFFGKNILNVLPIYIGGILYSRYEDILFEEVFVSISFATALAPFISEIAFSTNSYQFSYINGISLGIIIGFIIPPLAVKMKNFHEGYNLYNMGFTAGILGAVFNSVLKMYGFNIAIKRVLSFEFDSVLKIICSSIFILLIIIGFFINNCSFKDFKILSSDNGLDSDFVEIYGFGLAFINMGIMGFLAIFFTMILKEPLNGPMLAGIFTVVGFAAHGKTVLNTVPVLAGVLFAGITSENYDTFTLALSGLFGTSLAPITGNFGIFWGFVAGWLHLSLVNSIGVLHGGMNLYNNGFSAGIVAAFMLPVVKTVNAFSGRRNKQFIKKRKAILNVMKELNQKKGS